MTQEQQERQFVIHEQIEKMCKIYTKVCKIMKTTLPMWFGDKNAFALVRVVICN